MTSSAGTTTLTYDFESRITQISGPGINASYSYNGLDTRVGKTENSVANTFRRSGAYVTDPVLGDGSASYSPGVSVRSGGNVRYQHTGLNNTDSQASQAQSVAASRIYDAFGNVVSSSGTWTGPFGYAGNFGYQHDASGLKLLGHRYYDPSTGRFLTRDPIKDGRNWYAYGAGEAAPTTMVDSTGLAMTTVVIIVVAVALIAMVVGTGAKGSGFTNDMEQARGVAHTRAEAEMAYIVNCSDGVGEECSAFLGGEGPDGQWQQPDWRSDQKEAIRRVRKKAEEVYIDNYVAAPIAQVGKGLANSIEPFSGTIAADAGKIVEGVRELEQQRGGSGRVVPTPP